MLGLERLHRLEQRGLAAGSSASVASEILRLLAHRLECVAHARHFVDLREHFARERHLRLDRLLASRATSDPAARRAPPSVRWLPPSRARCMCPAARSAPRAECACRTPRTCRRAGAHGSYERRRLHRDRRAGVVAQIPPHPIESRMPGHGQRANRRVVRSGDRHLHVRRRRLEREIDVRAVLAVSRLRRARRRSLSRPSFV